jgi:peptidoglycan/xylan/chitin deacetylase (PgdA/CDA1 family)
MARSAYSKFRRVLSLFVSLAFYTIDSGWRLALSTFGKKPRPTCVVVYYHAVRDEERQAFAGQMDLIRRLTEPISVDRVVPMLPDRRYSAVTFDDGFENTIRNAVPELTKRGIPATIFAMPDLLGECASWWPESAPERCERLASAERLQQLPAELISVGSHTLTHPRLPSLAEGNARRELSESRIKLEQLLARPVKTFSFPYGDFNAQLVEWCRDTGYERVFTTLPVIAFSDPEEFAVGRVSVEPTDWPLEFRLKLLGAYRWLPLAYKLKRTLLSAPAAGKGRDLQASLARK